MSRILQGATLAPHSARSKRHWPGIGSSSAGQLHVRQHEKTICDGGHSRQRMPQFESMSNTVSQDVSKSLLFLK